MEQRNLLFAIALSFLVFLAWSALFGPKPSEVVKEEKTSQSEATESETAKAEPEKATQEKSVADAPLVQAPQQAVGAAPKARVLRVDTPLYTMGLSEKGAAVKSMVLKNYRETVAPDSPPKEVIPTELPGGTGLLSTTGSLGKALESAVYRLDNRAEALSVNKAPVTVRFQTITENGLQVEKAYTFSPDSYLVKIEVTLYNGGEETLNENLAFVLQQIDSANKRGYGHEGPSGLINNTLEQVKVKKINDRSQIEGRIKWIALESRYFMSALVAAEEAQGKMMMEKVDNVVRNKLAINNGSLGPSERKSTTLDIYIGPKSLDELRKLNDGLDRAIEFGWFDFIAKPCLWFMNFIYRFIPNYGVAIIILTIITRMIFWPLATKSYKSMSEMRKIQPLMQEVREKYKDDKNKMNQEMMALYRTYKINPMGGCLPILIQLPVFFALYRMLYQAIELRHAPFVWWINDLSAPDRLFRFNFAVPFMEEPYGVPVLTLIMGATMFLQQKMSPSPGDPTQAKMMMIMPVVFTFIFINFSSGLVLYWLVSNLLSITQQYYTQKKTA